MRIPGSDQPLPNHPTPVADGGALVPARMVNAWVYCPRLAYLQWVEGEWADNADTIDGKRVHRRIDNGGGKLPSPNDMDEVMTQVRSVTMSSERIGVIAKMDVVDIRDGVVMPVDTKRGKRPHVAKGAYEPERVQICLQAMILEENGYEVEQGAIWYAGSRERVPVKLDDELRTRTLAAVDQLRTAADTRTRPPPLEDSPKCPRCSLAGICLPDETNLFTTGTPPRPLNPSDDSAVPLYIQDPRAYLRKRGDRLLVEADDNTIEVPLIDVSQVALFGPARVTTQALHALMRAEIPVSWHSTGGWFLGHTIGTGNGNVGVREAQYKATFNSRRCLAFARELVNAKVRNSRTMLRRNWRPDTTSQEKHDALTGLKRVARHALHADDTQQLLGFEGQAAAIYFSHFAYMLASDTPRSTGKFDFTTRNRRPPTDPVNAMLSFSYALLVRLLTTTIAATGLDPYMGLYHRPRHGRPALALDLMEPFRSIISDSSVIQIVNNGEIRNSDFVWNGPACALKPRGRKVLIAAFERRLEHITTHPLFGYRVSIRRMLEVQARLLARHLQGEIVQYPHYLPR